MRSIGGALVVVCGCFTGSSAAGLPCDNDVQCGTELRCEQGFCGGPSGTSNADTTTTSPSSSSSSGPTQTQTATSNSSDTSSSGEPGESSSTGDPRPACVRPDPMPWACDGEPARGMLTTRQLDFPGEARSTAVAVGDYDGNGHLDLAVGHHDTRGVSVVLNAGTRDWPSGAVVTRIGFEALVVDMVSADLDCDGAHEFYTIGYENELESVAFDGNSFTRADPIAVSPGGFSLAVGDLVEGDGGQPELLVAFGDQVAAVSMIRGGPDGIAVVDTVSGVGGTSPWDMLVVPSALGARALVAQSERTDHLDGVDDYLHRVDVLRPTEAAGLAIDAQHPVVAANFQNPYALAVGYFTDQSTLQVAVAEKLIEGDFESSLAPGRIRVFDVDGGPWNEVASLEVGIGPRAIAGADLDCDGYTDLVVSNSGHEAMDDGLLQIAYGAQAGLEPNLETVDSNLGGGSTRIGVGDFDGNGRPEAAVADWAGDRLILVGFPN